MKKIKLAHDVFIPSYGKIDKGTAFKVIRFNKRFVYVALGRSELRLARKSDCEVVY